MEARRASRPRLESLEDRLVLSGGYSDGGAQPPQSPTPNVSHHRVVVVIIHKDTGQATGAGNATWDLKKDTTF